MEGDAEHKSVRDPNWHPRGETNRIDPITAEEIKLNIAFRFPPKRIAMLVEQEGLEPDNLNQALTDKLGDHLTEEK